MGTGLTEITDDDMRRLHLSGELYRVLATMKANVDDLIAAKIDSNGKDAPSGYAGLDGAGRVSVAVFPVGFTWVWLGTAASIPAGWLRCDGSAVSRSTYAALFAVLGVLHGPGNGTTTFNLPPADGAYLKGAAAAADAGGTGGALTHTHADHASHTHSVTSNVAVADHASHTHSVTSNVTATFAGTNFTLSSATNGVNFNAVTSTKPAGTVTCVNNAVTSGGPSATLAHSVTNNAVTSGGPSATLTHDTVNHEPPFYKGILIIKT